MTLTFDLVLRIIIWSTSLTFFKVGIPNLLCKCTLDGNLVCECILKRRIVTFHFPVTVTLTFDIVSRIGIKSGAKLLYSLGRNSKLDESMHLGMTECRIPFWVIVTLTSDLVYRIIVSGASHLYYLS